MQAERHGLKVAVANGEQLASGGICRNQAISVHEVFQVDCYSLP